MCEKVSEVHFKDSFSLEIDFCNELQYLFHFMQKLRFNVQHRIRIEK